MYMIPIRLWSVVVTQLVHPRRPVAGWGACTSCVVTSGIGAVVVAIVWAVFLESLGVFDLTGARLGAELRAGDLRLLVRFTDQLLLLGQPCVELGRRHGLDGRDHPCVSATADERALAAVNPRLERLEPGVVVIPGDHLDLAPELRDPPFVHDVGRDDIERYGRVRRADHLLIG